VGSLPQRPCQHRQPQNSHFFLKTHRTELCNWAWTGGKQGWCCSSGGTQRFALPAPTRGSWPANGALSHPGHCWDSRTVHGVRESAPPTPLPQEQVGPGWGGSSEQPGPRRGVAQRAGWPACRGRSSLPAVGLIRSPLPPCCFFTSKPYLRSFALSKVPRTAAYPQPAARCAIAAGGQQAESPNSLSHEDVGRKK
jgi:hypothetical protein